MSILLYLFLVFYSLFFFFFNDTATTEIYTLSLHDALPIFPQELKDKAHYSKEELMRWHRILAAKGWVAPAWPKDRKSTRLNSSHGYISYAVFCLKKKKKKKHK